MELNVQYQTFFFSCDGKQITDDILGWSASPRSTEGPGEPVMGHGGSFHSGDEEECHDQELQASLEVFILPLFTLDSSAPVGIIDSVLCNKEQCVLLVIQDDSHTFIIIPNISERLFWHVSP